MIDKHRISDVVKRIVNGYDPERIILFGSYAWGEPGENSDLDLLVVKDSELPRPQRTMQLRKILYGIGIPMDLIVYTPQEVKKSEDNVYSFIHEILKTGKMLYERKK